MPELDFEGLSLSPHANTLLDGIASRPWWYYPVGYNTANFYGANNVPAYLSKTGVWRAKSKTKLFVYMGNFLFHNFSIFLSRNNSF